MDLPLSKKRTASEKVGRSASAHVERVRPVLQVKHTPLIRVAGRRGAGQVNGRIDLRAVQLVNDAIADIVSGNEPVGADLLLNAEIPRVHVRRFQMNRNDGVPTRAGS